MRKLQTAKKTTEQVEVTTEGMAMHKDTITKERLVDAIATLTERKPCFKPKYDITIEG